MRLIDIEAINWYDDLFMKGENHSGVWVRYRDVEKLIRNAPTVDAVPVVRGKWIKKGCCAFCSNCGERIAITWTTTVEELVNVYRLKFCNNCGADMREVFETEQVKESAE